MIIWRFCGGVDFLKSSNKYMVWDKFGVQGLAIMVQEFEIWFQGSRRYDLGVRVNHLGFIVQG